MGGCDNVRSAAEALFKYHPTYYFLIDSDDRDDEIVEKSWSKFPDADAFNMLIWRKRELENYFIAPDYIEKSIHLKPTPRTPVRECILRECRQRLYMEAANLTLHRLNHELEHPLSIGDFKSKTKFFCKDDGILQLKECVEVMNNAKAKVKQTLQFSNVEELYIQFVSELSDDEIPLQYGKGNWLERISGKEVFNVIVNDCFQVKGMDGQILTGVKQRTKIAKELLRLDLQEQPDDFQKLVELLKKRIQ